MIKRSFLGLAKPRFDLQRTSLTLPEIREMAIPKRVTLLLKKPQDPGFQNDTVALARGDAVHTGQKIALSSNSDAYVVSTVTGTVSNVSSFVGDFGATYIAVSIDTTPQDVFDEEFAARAKNPDASLARDYFMALPGNPPLAALLGEKAAIHTLCILGIDSDILSMTQCYALMGRKKEIQKGIQALKAITRAERVVIAATPDVQQALGDVGAEPANVSGSYPDTLPKILMRDFFGLTVPPGKTCEDSGVAFFNAEAVAAVGAALDVGMLPVYKIVTITGKDLKSRLVSARIGTPVGEIFKALGITTNDMDRIVLGGPMTGSAIYSEDYPILPDTDSILVQDRSQIPPISQYPCINCGECVRICPANIAVNMLVRYLETGRYDEAADLYDLHCCIECGLCSFVCVARIPIFQYIRLGKHELARMKAAEAHHA